MRCVVMRSYPKRISTKRRDLTITDPSNQYSPPHDVSKQNNAETADVDGNAQTAEPSIMRSVTSGDKSSYDLD